MPKYILQYNIIQNKDHFCVKQAGNNFIKLFRNLYYLPRGRWLGIQQRASVVEHFILFLGECFSFIMLGSSSNCSAFVDYDSNRVIEAVEESAGVFNFFCFFRTGHICFGFRAVISSVVFLFFFVVFTFLFLDTANNMKLK